VVQAPRQHLLRVLEHPRRVGGVGGAVVELAGIGGEVEEESGGRASKCTYL
jgi:hypothetical protein